MTESPFADGGSNPYASPSIGESPGEAPFRLTAVIVGWLVDIGGSVAVGILLGIMLGMQAMARNPRATPDDLMALAAHPPLWFSLVGTGLGLLSTLAGGYVTARMARGSVWKHVFAMSVLSTLSGMAMLLMGSSPAWWKFPLSLTAIPAAFAGGWLRMATRRESA